MEWNEMDCVLSCVPYSEIPIWDCCPMDSAFFLLSTKVVWEFLGHKGDLEPRFLSCEHSP
jgi:hypothetical protein